ncbi:hypothetical protein Pint_22203 [Pistacia integerrima]|uniref:Uncharacterized protein n=1 Tax=Pistacia integerrima TaxID=434235 RepID=A0ACC0YHV1_9ROSI|nr:hypothetical protein Pint_22203 [Pistacia integerrima]
MSAVSAEKPEEDLWERARKAADNLYEIKETFFPQNPDDKVTRLQNESDLALKLLDSIPPEQRKSPLQRATYEYLRGKILDVVPDYRKEAEDHLSKAVKLNPSLTDAWLCLGVNIWKKGDLPAAKNCFNLALSKGPNKKILCQLSMLERSMAQGKKIFLPLCSDLSLIRCEVEIQSFGTISFENVKQSSENQIEIVEESIQHAKEAITLDVKDGNSWYNLGNACLTSFFVTGSWDHQKLLQSLKAYQNAEKDEKMKSNPDLYFNCATDPSLSAAEEVQKMVNLLDKIENLLKMWFYRYMLEANDLHLWHHFLLLEGLNRVAVVGKVLFFVNYENVTPLYYLVCDSNQTCFVLSVYSLRDNVIKEGDQVTLLQPYYRHHVFSWKGKSYNFKSIRVDFVGQMLLNGKTLSPQQELRSSVFAQLKP